MEIFTFLHQNCAEIKTSYLFSYTKYTSNTKAEDIKRFSQKVQANQFFNAQRQT